MTPTERAIMYETAQQLLYSGIPLEEALEDLTEEEDRITREVYDTEVCE